MIYCPLISQLPINEQNIWILQLNTLFSSLEQPLLITVVLDSSLSIEAKERCEFAIVANPVPSDLIPYKNLKWIQSLWAGVEKLVAELSSYSFAIVRLIDPMLSQIMSDAVLSWTLYLHRRMPEYLAQQKLNVWKQLPHILPQERTIAILGLGELGHESALLLKRHGFNVKGWSRTVKHITDIDCYNGEEGLYQAIENADVVVCLLPLTTNTRYLLNDDFFMKMKQDASLINFARGEIVEHDDLVDALNTKQLNHAVLDVFEEEPLMASSHLWQNDNISILPHISAPTHRESAVHIVVNNITHFMKDGVIPKAISKVKGY